jgi:cell division protein FtsI/penicillin-binding protein 2
MKEADPRAWQQTVRGRVLVAAALFAAWAVAIETRLVWLQVHQHDAMLAEAKEQKDRKITLSPRRGDIVDRRGSMLAISVDAVSICADPARVKFPEDLADAACWALGGCGGLEREAFVARLRKKGSRQAVLRRQVTLEESERVAAQQLTGMFMKPEPRRLPGQRTGGARA